MKCLATWSTNSLVSWSITKIDCVEGWRFADIREGVFFATRIENQIHIDHLVLTTGADFFCFFRRMAGNLVNTQNQIRLPKSLGEKRE